MKIFVKIKQHIYDIESYKVKHIYLDYLKIPQSQLCDAICVISKIQLITSCNKLCKVVQRACSDKVH